MIPGKDAGSDTTYTCPTGNSRTDIPLTFTDSAEFEEHLAESTWHALTRYTRTIKNLTSVGQEGASVDGILITSGYRHTFTDPFRPTAPSGYYLTHDFSNLTFKNISFNGKVDINTAHADTVIDGVTFENCSFTTNGTAAANGQAIRYYSESNNDQVKNLTVKDCVFENCYQGVYTQNISGITVTGCSFTNTGHNAIAIQSGVHGPVNHKAVVIENNEFTDIHDRIIRFGMWVRIPRSPFKTIQPPIPAMRAKK